MPILHTQFSYFIKLVTVSMGTVETTILFQQYTHATPDHKPPLLPSTSCVSKDKIRKLYSLEATKIDQAESELSAGTARMGVGIEMYGANEAVGLIRLSAWRTSKRVCGSSASTRIVSPASLALQQNSSIHRPAPPISNYQPPSSIFLSCSSPILNDPF